MASCPEVLHTAALAITGELNSERPRMACVCLEKPCSLRETRKEAHL